MYIQTNVDHDKVLTVMQRQNYITALLMEQQSTLSLPPRDIPTSDRDLQEYSICAWSRSKGC